MDLLTIGAFARLARLSPKALRLYDELNLLPPARVDPDTGYRWYSEDQLDRARQVAQLRQLDMPLARIRTVLDLPAEALASELGAYWEEQERGWRARRELVDFLVNHLTGKETPMFDVSVRDIPARALLTTSEHLTADQISAFAAPLFALFAGPTVARPEGVAGRPFLRYHGEISNDTDGLVEFCCPVTRDQVDVPDMTRRTEDAGREAYICVSKADMATALGFESLYRWLEAHKEQSDWRPRQTFLADPATVDAEDVVYELAVRLL
ncbi:helix-turn-helix domain-containing protein [Kibdelosporangium philippinense]|uniref:Helix-turn-helix domain-containing protein n=1 Tax=Kibdelosporangium philippinense TaxID=211113 RepID=A0ABS8Z8H7_9PSEU|nr:helix-turn-helix domain-containing protein [Kibdelosporangium philippinense]MCE7004130.1 helix-turn-helix domain-containing protein [Kibdelosporangium philippinense]